MSFTKYGSTGFTGALRPGMAACLAAGILAILIWAPACSNSSDSSGAVALGQPGPAQLEEVLNTELARLGIDPDKAASAAPTGEMNVVFDLTAELIDPDGDGPEPATTVELAWSEILTGDYNLDGVVNVTDLTPLGQNYLATVEYDDPADHDGFPNWPAGDPEGAGAGNWRLACIDGNHNGLVELGDITTIAQHWQEQVDGFRVYRMAPGETEYSILEVAGQPVEAQLKDTSDLISFSPIRYIAHDILGDPGIYRYKVAGYYGEDGEGQKSFAASCGFSGIDSDLLVVRNDGNVYPTNYNALTADLMALGLSFTEVDYYAGITDDYSAEDYPSVIWYRGGPGDDGEPQEYTTEWTSDEIDDYLQFMRNGQDLLLMSQSHGIHEDMTDYPGYAWEDYFDWDVLSGSIPRDEPGHPWATGFTLESGCGPDDATAFLKISPRNLMIDSPLAGKWPEKGVAGDYADDYRGAEGYDGEDSSGEIPLAFDFADNRQVCGMGADPTTQAANRSAPAVHYGISTVPTFDSATDEYDLAFVSWGCWGQAPYENLGFWPPPYNWNTHGNANLWIIGYSWSEMSVTDSVSGSMTRADVLLNVLAWLAQ